ncbi:MAG: hypothetical protein IJM44_01485 [Ruminococcus sp.]|nr:hypothetical protein [Ruminococcus sp.]
MTVYADYSFYTDEYLAGRSAAVTAADFQYYARQASAVIAQYTHGNIKADDIPDEVKMCCCELVETMHAADTSEAAQKPGVSSESVQGWSQSYESTEARKTALRGLQRDCIYRWLSNTGLLYSGVRVC